MTSPTQSSTVRRSIAIPAAVVEEATRMAPERLRGNFNQLVRTALEEFIQRRRDERFALEMERMAADPEILAEVRSIQQELAIADGDGL
jgi:metal-responsive CopG/Arc/MetJ family transcriptional regulator